ncbi:hypothetical protein FRC09_007072 [Ceratobasidium sp. 395]|nr:hypothetical protein FRC09_007072 [Ceratobasidium sp. 395]
MGLGDLSTLRASRPTLRSVRILGYKTRNSHRTHSPSPFELLLIAFTAIPPFTSSNCMTNPKDLVESHLAEQSPPRDVRPATPEPTTESGVTRGNALYDSEPEPTSGSRRRKSTERGDYYSEDYARKEAIRQKGNRTRARNAALRAHIPEAPVDTSDQQASRDEPRSAPLPLRRGRSRTTRALSRSPTPGSTDHEQEEPAEPAEPARPAITKDNFVFEKLSYKGLAQRAKEKYGIDSISDYGSQALLEKIRIAKGKLPTAVGASRHPASIVVLPAAPLQVGGGWHHDIPRSQPSASRGKKRGSDALDDGPNKRARTTSDTATETETETDRGSRGGLERWAAEQIADGCPDMIQGAGGSQLGTYPPPPSRASTPDFVPATQDYSQASSRSHSLGGSLSHYGESLPGEPIPPLPTLTGPSRDPVHHRLRLKAMRRYFDRADRDAELADAAAAQGNDEVDELDPTDDELDTSYAPGTSTQGTSWAQRTYSGSRSHVSSQPAADNSAPPEPNDDDDVPPVERPNSPSLTPAELIRKERARAFIAKARSEAEAAARKASKASRQQPRLYAETTHPPTNQPQPRSEPSGSGSRSSRRLDPASAARADLIAFNEAVARGDAASFVQSVTRRDEHTARCADPGPLDPHGLLEDDEEMLVHARALATGTLPVSSNFLIIQSIFGIYMLTKEHIFPTWRFFFVSRRYFLVQRRLFRGRSQKKKPLARDVSGIEREVLTQAKVHFYAYALCQGVYQTRAAFLKWARAVYQATWEMELPMVPFYPVGDWIYEIMVNNLATLRGRAKDFGRPFAAQTGRFEQSLTNQRTIQENLNRFNLLYPNNFHCRVHCPREGHFENPDVGRCIAVLMFSGPNAPGRLYLEYFINMPFPVVAFCMAIWKFCIGEWSHGWFQAGDLGMAAMRENYEVFLAALKDLFSVAPRRMARLQAQWRQYCEEYSGLSFEHQQQVAATGSSQRLEMRADTPLPEQPALDDSAADDSISVDEMNERLFETARQASLQQLQEEIIAREELENPGSPLNEEDWRELYTLDREDWHEVRAPTPNPDSPTPSPLPEYDENGRLTSRSKGKGRAD